MALKARSTAATRQLPTMRELMERRGSTVAELADRSGYTAEHIRRVMRGDHAGSKRFRAQMEMLLGGKYRVGGQLTWDEKLLPHGPWGPNDLESILKAQGITQPQGWPPKRPSEIDDEAADALIRAIEEMRRMSRERAAKEFAARNKD